MAEGALPPRAAVPSSIAPDRGDRRARRRVRADAACGVAALGEEFLPNFQEYDFLMHWVEKPGTSLEAMGASPSGQQRSCGRYPGCATSARTSAAPRSPTKSSARTSPSCGSASIRTSTTTRRSPKIQEVVDGYPGLYRDLLTYLSERIKEVLTGASATIVVRIYGPDLDDAAQPRPQRSTQRWRT